MNNMTEQAPADIHLDDLADPKLTPALIAAREGPADFPDHMTADEVLERAMQETGLSDFGEETGFRERLAVTIQALEEDKGLTRGGRLNLIQSAIRVMVNRLRIEDLVKRHPEILDIKIDRPVIIVGLPRSGTTHLVNWLARDTRLRSLTLWESEEPVPSVEVAPGEVDPRLARSAEVWSQFEAALPHMMAMHGMEASSIHEDGELLFMDLNSYNWEWQSRIPRWIDYYFSHDRTSSYLYERKILQVLTWYRGPNRWILKCPQHMENLGPLKKAFPDAKLVITHRDPAAVLNSLLHMVAYSDRIRRDPTDPEGLARHWVGRIEKLLRAFVKDRDLWGPEQSLDLLFHEYMADQEAVMRQVYELAELPLTADAESALLSYLNENPRNKYGKVIYDLERNFGITSAEIRERFGFYYERYPVKLEG